MQLTGHITADNLMTLEAYAKWRLTHKAEVMAHRRQRSVLLGEHLTVQFESETTIRYQIQEMLRLEKMFEPAGIQEEIDVYAPLVPDGSNWKATLLIAYPEHEARERVLAQLIGIEDRMFVQVDGFAPVYAVADEDLDRENAHKTSSVHFLRFEFSRQERQAIHQGARVVLGCDHPYYQATTDIAMTTLNNLSQDLLPA